MKYHEGWTRNKFFKSKMDEQSVLYQRRHADIRLNHREKWTITYTWETNSFSFGATLTSRPEKDCSR